MICTGGFGGFAEKLAIACANNAKTATGDYMEDGLLYCYKCHGKKQREITILGKKKIVHVMCQCEQAEYEKQKALESKRERYYRLMDRYRKYDIGLRGDPGKCDKRVVKYLENWPEMLKNGNGLLLWGDVGTGKSVSAAYLVCALKQQYVPAIMTNLVQFGDVKMPLPDLSDIDLLVIDDLGVERGSGLMAERAYEIVDSRIRAKKPTVYTTNLPLDTLHSPKDINYSRLYSRVIERSIPVLFEGPGYRDKIASDTIMSARILMGGK